MGGRGDVDQVVGVQCGEQPPRCGAVETTGVRERSDGFALGRTVGHRFQQHDGALDGLHQSA